MTTSSISLLDNENEHVQELKRLFLESSNDETGNLNGDGLKTLLDKLKLSRFANEITERVLGGSDTVDFYNFKDRFVAFLPEIIEHPSSSHEPLEAKLLSTLFFLGFQENQRLTSGEVRLVCDHVEEFKTLSVIDINTIFHQADRDCTGRITMNNFLQQYKLRENSRNEIHFIADYPMLTFNLFEFLDSVGSGQVDTSELIDTWNKVGLRPEEGNAVIKSSNQPLNGSVSLLYLSAFLENELSKVVLNAPVTIKAAILTLHLYIDHLRYSVRESDARNDYLHKQLQLANKRRMLLIDEMENNQTHLEKMYADQQREIEERHRYRLNHLEEKFCAEKTDLQKEMEQLEKDLDQRRQAEISLTSKLTVLEQQLNLLREENKEQKITIMSLNRSDREKRVISNKEMMTDSNVFFNEWKRRIDITTDQNRKLRAELERLRQSAQKNEEAKCYSAINHVHWSRDFKFHVLKLRLMRDSSCSTDDSVPDSIFQRSCIRRRRTRKFHMHRRTNVVSHLMYNLSESKLSEKSNRYRADVIKNVEKKIAQLKDLLIQLTKCDKTNKLFGPLYINEKIAEILADDEIFKNICSKYQCNENTRVFSKEKLFDSPSCFSCKAAFNSIDEIHRLLNEVSNDPRLTDLFIKLKIISLCKKLLKLKHMFQNS